MKIVGVIPSRYQSTRLPGKPKVVEIELLRLVENGIKIRVGIVDSETIAVDTEKDLERVREIIYRKNHCMEGEF